LRLTSLEATRGRAIVQRAVWPLRVVVLNPFVHRLLCGRDVLEDLPGVELQAKRLVESLDLPRRGRRAGLGEDVLDAVLPADPVEQHLHRGLPKPPADTLA